MHDYMRDCSKQDLSGTTLPVHVSLWTSVYPASHGVFSNHYVFAPNDEGEGLQVMAQMFKRAGYTISTTPRSRLPTLILEIS